jgi:hemolysin activation/secretion protein
VNTRRRRHQTLASQFCFAAFALAAAVTANAQALPNSGELLQTTPRTVLPAPSSNTGLTIPPAVPGEALNSAAFFVEHVAIGGNTLLAESELRSLARSSEGKNVTLADLQALAARITKDYQDHGYLLSRAYIPAQNLSHGIVRITVLEARYGAVSLSNHSKVSDGLLKSYFAKLPPGEPVTEKGLDRTLLLLSDVPGAVVNSTLAPGIAAGTSDLLVSATPGLAVNGSAGLDDAGNRYTGRARLSGTLNINEPLGQGDVLSTNGMTSGSGLAYGRLGYTALMNNGNGTTLGGAVSDLHYALGNGLSELHAHGTAQVESLTLMQPFIRGVDGNLFVLFAFDSKQLHDEIDTADVHTDRRTSALTASVAADHHDATGISNMNLGYSFGHLEFANDAAEIADSLAAKTRGNYSKLTLSLARLQGLSQSNSVYFAFNGQTTNNNLDSSEQFFLGGPNSVRAYDVGAVGGAQGALASAEFRHNLSAALSGWQAIAFVDSGAVRIYKETFVEGKNSATLSGAGVGLNWLGRSGWTASAAVATPLGGTPSLVGDSASTRVWLELRKNFTAGHFAR